MYPVAFIKIKLSLKGSAAIKMQFSSSSKTKFNFTFSAFLVVTAKIVVGIEKFASVESGAKGTIISGKVTAGVTSSQITKSFSLSGGKITVFVKGYLLGWEVYNNEWVVFNGWTFKYSMCELI